MSDTLLSVPQNDFLGETPFSGDLLGRSQLGELLTNNLHRLSAGAVLAIDGSWGEGKTWFGRNWEAHLKSKSHKVIYIDAFEQDYIEDPFLLISAEILGSISQNDISKKLTDSAVGIAKTLMPLGTKVLINAVGQWALGTSNLSDKAKEILENTVEDTSEQSSGWIKDRLTKHTCDKATIKEFKIQLEQVAKEDPDRPMVIIIDELDRCKPTFAVGVIERIKHFFDVQNVVFVLLLNRNQLEKAIKGVYGAETDAATYLSKFVNFFFKLPKERPHQTKEYDRIKSYVKRIAKKYAFENITGSNKGFFDELALLSFHFDLSLRDIERCIALYAFTDQYHIDAPRMMAYVVVLKVTNSELLARILSNQKDAHLEAKQLIDSIIARLNHEHEIYLEVLSQWHSYHLDGFQEMSTNFKAFATLERIWIDPDRLFTHLSKKIDLPMS